MKNITMLTTRYIKHQKLLKLSLFSLAFLFVVSGTAAHDESSKIKTKKEHEHPDRSQKNAHSGEGSPRSLVEHPGHINMKAVLEHQAALEEECAKYHKAALNQVQHLMSYDENNENLEFQRPLSVKVPSVCLYLFTQFRKSEPWNELQHQSKVDFVNWIYNEDMLKNERHRDEGKGAHNSDHEMSSNRAHSAISHPEPDYDITSDNSTNKRHSESQDSEVINDYLLDPHATANEIESEDMRKFHKTVEDMMANEQFHRVINKNRNRISPHLSPVILVPGLLGSRLQARADKKTTVNILCSKQHDWKDMWLSVKNLLPFLVDCWLDNVRLELDDETGFTHEPAGVQSRVVKFGNVESVSHLDPSKPQLTKYFASIIDTYTKLGYTPNENLLAAPYDFRLAPQQLGDYYRDLKKLVEDAQDGSEMERKVTFVCHSMGCTHLLVFLREQSKEWRDAHVRKLIAISSPWGGSTKALKALVVGDRLDLPVVSEAKMRMLARNYPSMAFLLPQPGVFGAGNDTDDGPGGPVLVETPERSYKAADIEDLLKDLGLSHQLKWFKETSVLIKPDEPIPDLRVDCIHTLNTPTPQKLIFKNQSDFPDKDYELVKGNGDGTVNHNSLLICEGWSKKMPHLVKHRVILNANHVGLLNHKTTMTFITDDVLRDE